MNSDPRSFSALIRRPSGILPLAMSLAALADVLLHIVFFGTAPERDEGAAAHIWQLLMCGQVPFLIWFAVRWLPRAARASLAVLALQAGAVLVSLAPVFLLHW
jgi:hypothetical protein